MRVKSLCCLLLLFGASAAIGAPRRIVSLNLCTDQLVLALADPGQIAALTNLARDRAMSAEAERADHVPIARGNNENLLIARPDLVLGPPGTAARIAGLGVRRVKPAILELSAANSYREIRAQILQVAVAVGHDDRGTAMVRRMDRALAQLRPVKGGSVAAYYQRRGYLTGTGTLVDDLMQGFGLINLAAKLGKPALSHLSLEELVMARPDYLIVETATDTVTDQGTEMLHHPALAGIPRLRLPEAWTVCGGPAYLRAVQSLDRQLRERRR